MYVYLKQFCLLWTRTDPVPRGQKLTSHIVIGTPGKMTDWAFRLNFLNLSTIRVFCLDEADVMIATQGYQDSSIKIHR
jgi:ATP-dependent RNA helicase DDX19/DBP5